ncbi:hypothetical protein SAMN02910384_01745 [Pseudobutyrivibrio sp. ACV-2]|uniref:hypothetical protein n=1 Tax=Pseudobutyrivibrio sp. ACV-2 TaxID=1520801 RepID=UPI000898FAC7|nr:hypothetical protein [Pseudobutyrivibrio sp. ACV-2]SEA55584.1 hypothetical protein SAMN02910384_01745 [Pseudobutyrivibrio sp. ACV-2]
MNTQIELFDLNETIEIKESINNLRIKDLDKLKQKAEVLDDEDLIKVKIIPNPGEEALCDCIDELVTDLSA